MDLIEFAEDYLKEKNLTLTPNMQRYLNNFEGRGTFRVVPYLKYGKTLVQDIIKSYYATLDLPHRRS